MEHYKNKASAYMCAPRSYSENWYRFVVCHYLTYGPGKHDVHKHTREMYTRSTRCIREATQRTGINVVVCHYEF